MIYDITFADEAVKLSPPRRREYRWNAWFSCLLKPLQWNRDILFGDYLTGSVAPDYNPAATYAIGARVRGKDKAIYEAVLSVPVTTPPPNGLYWYKILDNFIGLQQRLKANSQTMVLQGDGYTIAGNIPTSIANERGLLNLWFGVNSAPFIKIQNNTDITDPFLIFENDGSNVFEDTSSAFIREGNPQFGTNDFTISVPTSVSAAYGGDTIMFALVRVFVSKYLTAGIIYNINTY